MNHFLDPNNPSYEERSKYLDTIVRNHKDCSTFEDFSAHVFEPALARQRIQSKFYSKQIVFLLSLVVVFCKDINLLKMVWICYNMPFP